MAQTGFTPIQIYHSTTPTNTPSAGDLVDGELAINTADGKLFYKDSGGSVQTIATTAGANGDVVGPASATDNAIVRFDGTTGKLVQNSAATIDDTTGDITAGAYNKVTITAPATSATLTIADGKTLTANNSLTLAGVDAKTLTVNNSLTLAGTDATTMTFPATSATIARTDAAQTFTGTQTFSSNPILNGGTANGVAYADGSKVLTTGSALTFDGTNLSAGSSTQNLGTATARWGTVYATAFADGTDQLVGSSGTTVRFGFGTSWTALGFGVNGSEQMRLTSTGLGIGESNPTQKLDVVGNIRVTSASASTTFSNGANFTTGATTDSAVLYSGNLLFGTSPTERMRLDSSGNLGLGGTPKPYLNPNYNAFDMHSGRTVLMSSSGTPQTNLQTNAYYDSTDSRFEYSQTGYAASNYVQQGGEHKFFTAPSGTAGNAISFTQAMTLDASGNLSIGDTTPTGRFKAVVANSGTLQLAGTFTNNANADFNINIKTSETWVGPSTSTPLIFANSGNTERARITSGGYFKASDDGVYAGAANTWHEFNQSANSLGLAVLADNASFTSSVVEVSAARNTTDNTYYFLDCAVSGVAYRFRVADSGNVTNTNGSYGTISDAKMKTDIVDAGSQWSDIKALRFRKFKMKDDPEQIVQLGVVAQEVEQVSPGLVEEHIDRDAEGNDLGTTTKSVKTSVLLMKAAIALQEAMARIEALEARVAALESN